MDSAHRGLLNNRNKSGFGTVAATTILMVAAITLGIMSLVFTGSLLPSASSMGSIYASNHHIWVNQTGNIVYGAAAITNTGDELLKLDTVKVRGLAIQFSHWYYDDDQSRVTLQNIYRDLSYPGNDVNGLLKDSPVEIDGIPATIDIDFDGNTDTNADQLILSQAKGPITIPPGKSVIIYFKIEDRITSSDVGSTVTINMFSPDAGAVQQVGVGTV